MQKVALPVAILAAVASSKQVHSDDHVEKAFAAFIQQHSRTFEVGSEEYNARLVHFKQRVDAVEAHNAKADQPWAAAVNALADRSPEELAMLRGYRRGAKTSSSGSSSILGLASTSVRTFDVHKLPKSFTWRGKLAAMEDVRDQGACGSCWAISSSAVLRAHAELYQKDRTFSTQQIVECTANPQQCGGQGGCKGATAELAMDYVTKLGLATEEAHSYKATDGTCRAPSHAASEASSPQQSLRSIGKHIASFLGGVASQQDVGASTQQGGVAFGMTGWQKLPENAVEPLLLAVYEKGPVVVSVAATDAWSMYSSGVMKACDKGAVINHAVVLVGFGEEGDSAFWQIQNSWGKSWGEGGFIRMLRHGIHEEGTYCGWDEKPEDGTACKGGPSKAWVCGSCGVLYDSVVPTFTLSKDGFLSRHTRDAKGIFTQLNASTSQHLRH